MKLLCSFCFQRFQCYSTSYFITHRQRQVEKYSLQDNVISTVSLLRNAIKSYVTRTILNVKKIFVSFIHTNLLNETRNIQVKPRIGFAVEPGRSMVDNHSIGSFAKAGENRK